MRKPFVVFISVILGALVAWLLEANEVHGRITSASATGIPAFIVALNEYLEQKSKSKQERLDQLLTGEFYINPIIVSIYLLLAMQLMQRIMAGFIGFLIGGYVGGLIKPLLDPYVYEQVFYDIVSLPASRILALIIFIPTVFFMAKRATHYIRSRQVFCVLGAVLASQLLTYSVGHFIMQMEIDYLEVMIVTLILVGAGALGSLRGIKTNQDYLISRLFKQLSSSDKDALIELIKTLPENAHHATRS